MSTLRLPGILTGIDTNQLIAQLMAVERRTLNVYQERQETWQGKQDALGTLETKLDTLRSSTQAISDAQQLQAFATASSDTDIVTANASYNAFEGNHTIVINQLANAERHVHTNGIEYAEDYVGEGTFIYSYNHQETAITTTSTTTLENLVGLINNDADNPGVTANLLYFNDAYHLVLNGNDAGSDYQISVNGYNTELWQTESAFTVNTDNAALSTRITELDQFDGTLVGGEYITIGGKQHDGTVVNQNYSINANTKLSHIIAEINDAFGDTATAVLVNGEIRLTDHTCGTSQMGLTLTYDQGSTTLDIPTISRAVEGGTVPADLTGFTEADFAETQSAQDSEIRVDGYPSEPGIAEVQTLSETDVATSGTYTLTYDGETTAAISYDADLIAIRSALEALSNVEAGDITVSGERLDQNGDMIFTFRNTTGDVSMISIDSGNLTPSSGYTISETTKGDSTNCWIRRSSNTIDDVVHGVTLHLHDAGTVQVNLTRDIDSVKEKLTRFIDAYNAVVSFIDEKTGYSSVTESAGILIGDYAVSTIKSQLRNPLYVQTNGFLRDIDTFLTPAQIGFELDRNGILNLDTNAFEEAIAQDYTDVLALIGADKTGSSSNNTIGFYGAHTDYTTAGTYDVEVTVIGGAITSAKIKLATESTYRDATVIDNIIMGDSSFDGNGDPVYPENGLQLSVDLSQDGTFTATVRVKQGFAGAVEDAIDRMIKATTGSIQIDQEHVGDIIEQIQDKIEAEEYRLTQKEDRLIGRFARLEKTLALMQNQLAALGLNSL